jgi:nucleotide-binding universal stress UspA family protein
MIDGDGDRRDGPGGDFTVRRIVVALDSSGHAAAALEAAAALAERLQAELEGLFVEDVDLLNLAGLEISGEFSLRTGSRRLLDTRALEEQLQREAAKVRRALDAAAQRARIQATFRIARGRVTAEVIAAAEGADLLILGAASHAVGFRFRPGRVALAAAAQAPHSVLVIRSGTRITGKPLVPYDGSPGAEKALATAATLARLTGNRVGVLITEPDAARAAALRERALRQLRAANVQAVLRDELEPTLDTLCRLIARTDSDLLVIPAEDPKLAGEGSLRLLERVPCPVMLVR